MQMNSIQFGFKSYVKWTREELDFVVSSSLERINASWPTERMLMANEWEQVDRAAGLVDSARDSKDRHDLRAAVGGYEKTLSGLAGASGPKGLVSGKILF